MILHVSIIWVGPAKSVEVLTPIFNLADDWLSFGPAIYVMRTTENLFTWQGRLKAVVGDGDCFFISQISDPSETAGWMPPSFWDWLRKGDQQTIQGTFLPPILTLPNPFKNS